MKNPRNICNKHRNAIFPTAPLSMTTFQAFILFCAVEGPVLALEKTPKIVDHVAIRHQEIGRPGGYTLPVYQVGDIRFLSGGVGVEEREATYPSFSVKLVLAQQPGAFLTHASILFQDSEGHTVLDIPHELVTGPWVFVNLPAGTYRVDGKSRDGIRIERTIQVKPGTTRVHHLTWPAP